MRNIATIIMLALVLASCALVKPKPEQNLFLVFFVPGTAQLSDGALMVVRQAAQSAKNSPKSKINILVPPDRPGLSLTEQRFSAIQNTFSASGIDPRILGRTSLSDTAAEVSGANDRAEIRITR